MDKIQRDVQTIRDRLDYYILYGKSITNPIQETPQTTDDSYDAPHNRHLIGALIYGSCVSLFIMYVIIVLTLMV